jgi:MHS family proline/betaine transporter-like MFS transporter
VKKHNPTAVMIFSASIGGLLEMYDFTIYAFLAPMLSQLFFKPANEKLGLILTFVTFAIGFLVRPLGGLLFGHIGDRFGRRTGLLITIFLMGLATVLIGCLPTYQQAGLAAPILLLALRATQGLCVGGDLPGGMTYLSEETADNNRGRHLGYLFAGINLGTLLAAGVIFMLHQLISSTAFMVWGWRIVFLSSLVFSLLGLWQRANLAESVAFRRLAKHERRPRLPIVTLFKEHGWPLLKAMCLLASFVLLVCQFFIYGPTYLHHFFHLSYHKALQLNCLASACYSLSFLLFGRLADRIGQRHMRYLTLLLLILSPASYYLLLQSGWWISATVLFATCGGFFSMGLLLPFNQLFPSIVRYSGVGFSYNALFALGGAVPAILTATIPLTNSPVLLPVAFLALTTLLYWVYLFMRSRRRQSHPATDTLAAAHES